MGGRFCSLDQTHSECESTLVEIMSFRPRNRVKTKKKVFTKNWRVFLPKIKLRPKRKRNSTQFGTKFGWNLWDLFVLTGPFSSDRPALKSRWGTLNLHGGTLIVDGGRVPPHPPYNLSTGYYSWLGLQYCIIALISDNRSEISLHSVVNNICCLLNDNLA